MAKASVTTTLIGVCGKTMDKLVEDHFVSHEAQNVHEHCFMSTDMLWVPNRSKDLQHVSKDEVDETQARRTDFSIFFNPQNPTNCASSPLVLFTGQVCTPYELLVHCTV